MWFIASLGVFLSNKGETVFATNGQFLCENEAQ